MEEKELLDYISKFNQVKSKYEDFTVELNKYRAIKFDVGKYCNILLQSMGRLSNCNTDILKFKKSGYGDRWLIATPSNGIRCRTDWSKHSRELNQDDMIEVFKHDVVEEWIKSNRPDKLAQFQSIRSAFVNGFSKEYICGREYSSNDREVSQWVDMNINTSFTHIDDDGGRQKHNITRLSVEFNLNRSYDRIAYYDGKIDKSFGWDWHNFIFAEPLFEPINKLLDDAGVKAKQLMSARIAWFNDFKTATQKWASIINL